MDCSVRHCRMIREAMFALHLSKEMRRLKVCHSLFRSCLKASILRSTRNTWLYSNSDKRSNRSTSTCNSSDVSALRPWGCHKCRQADQAFSTLYSLRLGRRRSIQVCLQGMDKIQTTRNQLEKTQLQTQLDPRAQRTPILIPPNRTALRVNSLKRHTAQSVAKASTCKV